MVGVCDIECKNLITTAAHGNDQDNFVVTAGSNLVVSVVIFDVNGDRAIQSIGA